jgi:heme oxygenase
MEFTPNGIMVRLRAATRELHDQAERHPFQRDLATGILPRDSYAEYLGQMYHIHGALEGELRSAAQKDEAIRSVVRDYQFKEELLREDVSFLGLEVEEIDPVPATMELIADIHCAAEEFPRKLLGYHYVLEGSTNGGKHVVRVVRGAYGLSDGAGTLYLDPYGVRQQEHWQAFKRDMGRLGFSDRETGAIVEAACEMFRGILRISDALYSRSGSVAAPPV